MSDEYERDDEEEYKPRGPPPFKPPTMPPPSMPPPSIPPPTTSYEAPIYDSAPTIPSGPSQADYNAIISQVQERDNAISQMQHQINQSNAECANLNAQIMAKDNQINQLTGQIQSLQTTMGGFQTQITQLNNEKAQLQAHIPQLESQLQQVQQENMNLQQQIGPLQAHISKLQEESAYKDKRIQELKEPKAVMPSSLAQGITSQSPPLGSTPSFGTSPTSSPSITPTPNITGGIGSGRRLCPNCGATGFAIKEVEDKSKILSYIPKPQYAKKSVCTKCGFEF
jgi:ABC-type transporter Mla subunit MlaD